MIHVSTSCNACFHTTGALPNADTTAFMQCPPGRFVQKLPAEIFDSMAAVRVPNTGALSAAWRRRRSPLLEERICLTASRTDTCTSITSRASTCSSQVIPLSKMCCLSSEMIGRGARQLILQAGPLPRRHQALHRGLRLAQR